RAPVGAPDDTTAIDARRQPMPAAESDSAASTSIWIELPDAAQVEPARRWLGQLPIARRKASRALGPDPGPADGDSDAWIHLGARSLEAFAAAWERRPRNVLILANARMQQLPAENRTV